MASALFLYPVSDADLGWHLRYGEYFLNNYQILRANVFSYTMTDYQWINHSWMYDIIVALINKIGQFPTVSFFGGLLIGISFAIMLQPTLYSLLILPFGWYLASPLLSTGLKSHYISLLMFALIIKIIDLKQTKYHFLLPLIFFLWSNLHGQFLFGLCVVAIYFIVDSIKHKKINQHFFVIVLASLLVTFVNPWGYRLHLDILSYIGNPLLQGVTEWQPWPWGLRTFGLYISIIFSTWLLYQDRKSRLSDLIVMLLLSVLALTSRRMIPYVVIFSLPIISRYLAKQFPSKYSQSTAVIFSSLAISVLILIYRFETITNQNWQTYCASEIHCSQGAIDFINQNHIVGKLFNAYRLGGHLIYQYPQMPVFIDGRMTLWQTQNLVPFRDYQTMIYSLPNSRQLFHSYNFDYALLNHEYPLTRNLIEVERWSIIYQDKFVVLLRNPNFQS